MPAVVLTSPQFACSSQKRLGLTPKTSNRPSQACLNKSFCGRASTPIKLKHERYISRTQSKTYLSAPARNVKSTAAYQTDTQQTSSSGTRTEESNGWAWILGGLTLTSGTSAPALYIGSHWNEITQMASSQRTAGIAAADAIFILAASIFIFCGHQFGLQRNGKTVRFPGPMVELDGRRRAPDFFLPYVSFIILGTILVPLVALGLLTRDGDADLGLSTLGVYLLCLIVQIASESIALRTDIVTWGSAWKQATV